MNSLAQSLLHEYQETAEKDSDKLDNYPSLAQKSADTSLAQRSQGYGEIPRQHLDKPER